MESSNRRGITWWIVAVITPIGVLTGPLAVADLLSGLIEWNGPIKYLVYWWDENISGPIKTVIEFIATFLNITSVPDWISDYLAAGLTIYISALRSISLTDYMGLRIMSIHIEQLTGIRVIRARKSDPRKILFHFLLLLISVLAWPMFFLNVLFRSITWISWQVGALFSITALLFLSLLCLNVLYA